MTQPTIDPRDLAAQAARDTAEDPDLVGELADVIELDDSLSDYRFAARKRGYEGWQWSVTLFHDVASQCWTVDETTLVPTKDSILAPPWIPWKDRLRPEDISVTEAMGTAHDDPRLDDGFRPTDPQGTQDTHEESGNAQAQDEDAEHDAEGPGSAQSAQEDVDQAVDQFRLSRRHVLTALGRAQAAQRWYQGQHGPRSLSTKTAEDKVCSTCGFFIPLQSELNLMFGVCANKWSPDDGRVVSIDHGCGEHSEIDPPETTPLWVQSEPAFDDMHIDVVAQAPREERGAVELMEQQEDDADAEDTHESGDSDDGGSGIDAD